MTYWNKGGKYPELVKLCENMLPAKGPTGYKEIEAYRAAVQIYYDLYNNGFGNNWSGAFNYLKSLDIPELNTQLLEIESYKFGEVYGQFDETDDVAVAVEHMMDLVLLNAMYAQDQGGFTKSKVDMLTMTEKEPIKYRPYYDEYEDD